VHELLESWKSDPGSLKNVDYGEKKHPWVLFSMHCADTGFGAEDEGGHSNRLARKLSKAASQSFETVPKNALTIPPRNLGSLIV
jgi:hypothetical protein